jgi:glycosyltransferase involved in cell wall biosynthesis
MKGADLAINVLNKINNKNTLLIFICQKITYNLYYLYLKLLILKLHIFSKKKVIILENLNQKIKNRIFSNCDYFIHTSRLECSPLVMFEALSQNKIFFGTDVGNVKEIITSCKVGFVSNSLDDIAKNIDKSISKKDHSNSKLINKINNYFNKKFDWKIIIPQYEKIINKLLA